ncbi:Serpin A3-8 [Thelohanellus kitauei]|uniref:Serpin A3-8 n=1 Tax=Thelohanellus kitauei TaxID=669202 RepID=A0A0C2N605_THEKT|nr:Serpin A3-8 [Thelohanellus kitauei]
MLIETINNATILLARCFLEDGIQSKNFAFSGLLSYLTLAVINIGLQGPTKYQLSEYLNNNFTHSSYQMTTNKKAQRRYLVGMEYLESISQVYSSIFYSGRTEENFEQMAMELFDFELFHIHGSTVSQRIQIVLDWIHEKMPVIGGYSFKMPFDDEFSTTILNTCYIKHKWDQMFNTKKTTAQLFTNGYDQKIVVPMMKNMDAFKVYEDPMIGSRTLFMPFENEDIYAAIVVPFHSSIEHILNKINVRILTNLRATLFSREEADMSQMMKDPAYLNDYYQFASIDINESGTYVEVTPEVISNNSTNIPKNILQFHVDKPFIFYIYARPLKLIIFFAVVTNPIVEWT